MALPAFSMYCRHVQPAAAICATFPGGAQLCSIAGLRFGDLAAISESYLGQLSTALMPLQPIFNIIDAFTKVVDAIKNPTKIVDLVKAISKLAGLVPALSVPLLVKGILSAIVGALSGLKQELHALADQQTRIATATALASQPGNEALQEVIDCASANLGVQLDNLASSMGPVNTLLNLVNVLLGLAGLQQVPSASSLPPDAEAALAVLDATISVLQTAAAAIPG